MEKDINIASQAVLNQKVSIALIMSVYQQAKLGFIASLLCASVIFYYLINTMNATILLGWYFSVIFIIAIRWVLVKFFMKLTIKDKHLKIWRELFTIGAVLSGISWGVTGTSLFLSPSDAMQQIVILVILAGISSGAVPLLAPIRSASIAFCVCAILPLICHFFLIEGHIYDVFTLALIIYLTYLIVLSCKIHTIIKNSFKLQFQNQELVKDLSEAKNELEITNQKLQLAATHDPLTRVANRSLFEYDLKRAIERAERDKKFLALFYFDLDHFKEANDLYGHDAGDQILIITVERIKHIIRDEDIISRLGGDELTVIIEDIRDIESVSDIAERLCEALAKPIVINNNQILISASIGISIFPVDGMDMESLVKVADRAMYYVKEHGGNNYHFNVQLEK